MVAVCSVPLTGGISLFAFGAGTALGIGGAVTNIGAEIKVGTRESNLLREAKRILELDSELANQLDNSLCQIKTELDEILQTGATVGFMASSRATAALARIAPKVVSYSPRTGKTLIGIGAAGKVFKGFSVIFGVATIPLEIKTIVENSAEIGSGSESAKAIDRVVEQLERNLEELRGLISD